MPDSRNFLMNVNDSLRKSGIHVALKILDNFDDGLKEFLRSDFRLTRAADQTTVESNEICGVLPYIAPEVLRGYPYTTAADIYFFDIIIGLRPKIKYLGEHPEYVMLMMRCWDSDPTTRPTAEELTGYFKKLRDIYMISWYIYKRVSVPSKSVKNHDPRYLSKRYTYSSKLNEGLSELKMLSEDLNCKISRSKTVCYGARQLQLGGLSQELNVINST
ncbi:kinase-like domain-containing protein [Rhizophagus clarus]|uniref:Kinase-like domain-containing protein n=1 Tax=Rhizophagus clarus TaxID=94130 RepID=A0A8H3L412_9GLOM|nr:kinase-like domain-containing protein [Rhizophagus clarus]